MYANFWRKYMQQIVAVRRRHYHHSAAAAAVAKRSTLCVSHSFIHSCQTTKNDSILFSSKLVYIEALKLIDNLNCSTDIITIWWFCCTAILNFMYGHSKRCEREWNIKKKSRLKLNAAINEIGSINDSSTNYPNVRTAVDAISKTESDKMPNFGYECPKNIVKLHPNFV